MVQKHIGETVTITFNANNIGNAPLNLTAFYSANTPIGSVEIGVVTVGSLAVGASKTVTKTYVVPPLTPDGTWNITVSLEDTSSGYVYATGSGSFQVVSYTYSATITSLAVT